MVYKLEQNKNMKLTIPYYLHKAGAGFPSPATDYIEEDIDLNMHLIRNVPATFIIRVQGKSMVDVGINDGDLLVCLLYTSPSPRDGTSSRMPSSA